MFVLVHLLNQAIAPLGVTAYDNVLHTLQFGMHTYKKENDERGKEKQTLRENTTPIGSGIS
jgi:hypothetical protein